MMKCVKCMKGFNGETHAPRMLACGHTFCHTCISTLLDSAGELTCPTCEHKQSVNRVEDVPLNRALLEIIFQEERDQKIPQESLCFFHKKVLKSFCNKCREYTCQDCYKELHNREFGCDEVCFSDDVNLERSTVVKKLNDRIHTLTSHLKKGEEQLGDLKTSEASFKEFYWRLSQHRMHLEANCKGLRENLSSLETSRSSIIDCTANSDFIDCCKGLFFLKTPSQATRDTDSLPALLSSSSICKNIPMVYSACQRLLPEYHRDNLATLEVDGSRFRIAHSFPLEGDASLLDLFKKLNSIHLRKIKLSWPLEGKEFNDYSGKCVYADIELRSDKVETFYKFFSLGKEEDIFTCTNQFKNFIVLHKSPSNIRGCINNSRYKPDDNLDFQLCNIMLGLNIPNPRPTANHLNIGHLQWPVLVLVSESAPELIFAKFPLKQASNAFQLVGTWKIGGDVEDMPYGWQSTSWRLSSNM